MSGLMIPPREYHGECFAHEYQWHPDLAAWRDRTFTTQAEYAAAGGYTLIHEYDGKRDVIDFQTLKAAEIRKLLPKAKRTRREPATKRHSAPQREVTPKITATAPVMPCPFCDATFALDATDTFREHLTAHMTTPAAAPEPIYGRCDGCRTPHDGPGLYCPVCDPSRNMARSMTASLPANVTPIRKSPPAYDPAPQANPTRAAVLDVETWTPPSDELAPETARVAAWCAAHHLPAFIVGRWVWIQFDAKPDDATRERIKAEGFRWVQTRKAWAHHCGYRSKKGSMDPRIKYGMVPVSDDRDGMAAD